MTMNKQTLEHAIDGIQKLIEVQQSNIARLNRSIELHREYTHMTAQEKEDNLSRLHQQVNRHEVKMAELKNSQIYFTSVLREVN